MLDAILEVGAEALALALVVGSILLLGVIADRLPNIRRSPAARDLRNALARRRAARAERRLRRLLTGGR